MRKNTVTREYETLPRDLGGVVTFSMEDPVVSFKELFDRGFEVKYSVKKKREKEYLTFHSDYL